MFSLIVSMLLQLSLFMLAEAAPITAQTAKPWQTGAGGGIVGCTWNTPANVHAMHIY